MTGFNQLVENHIDQYESRLKQIDLLLERASTAVAKSQAHADIHTEIANLRAEREKFASQLGTLKQKSINSLPEEMLEKSGPMGIWDEVAQQLEKLVERIER
jgi:transcriptional/translational regulatory protein YebC/TACO1